MPGSFTFHHVGVAVPDVERAMEFYASAFGFKCVSGPFEDPIQKVKVCFLADAGKSPTHIELISPLTEDSSIKGYLTKGTGAYHVCYEVEDLSAALAELWEKGCLIVSNPAPAVAFGGKKIAWCYTPTNQLVELLEG
jgi:methylmalonyl-CoA/ethylmalonyl-CoA epimerase